MVCFSAERWKKLIKLIRSPVVQQKKNKKKFNKHQKNYSIKESAPQSNIVLLDTSKVIPAENLWDIWNENYDEQHKWGDLSREEEIMLKEMLQGKQERY